MFTGPISLIHYAVDQETWDLTTQSKLMEVQAQSQVQSQSQAQFKTQESDILRCE